MTITNLGDRDSTDDVNIGDAAGGDLSGTYPDPTVAAIQGADVSTTAPTANQILKFDGTAYTPSIDEVNDGDFDAGNELQNLSVTGASLTISSGNTVTLVDADSTNEFQSISLSNDTIFISDDASFVELPDGSATIEIQTLSQSGLDLTISSGNTITLDVDDADANASNELQAISLSNDTIFISQDASFVELPDASATNELQAISLSNDTIFISQDASFVELPDGSNVNELQDLSYNATTDILSLSSSAVTVDFSGFIEPSDAATGDLGGTVGNPSVDGIQGVSVSSTAPDNGEVLLYNGTEWTPDTLTSTSLVINSSLIPDANNSYDIGSSSNRYSTLYLQNSPDVLSDARFKQSIQPLSYGLTELLLLQPVSYQLKGDAKQQTQLGFLAQDVQPVINEVVNEHPNADSSATNLGMSYTELIPVIIKGMQEQQDMIDEQQQMILEQKVIIDEMRKELYALISQKDK